MLEAFDIDSRDSSGFANGLNGIWKRVTGSRLVLALLLLSNFFLDRPYMYDKEEAHASKDNRRT